MARISHQGLTFFSLIIPGWKIQVQQNRLPLRAGSQGCFPQASTLTLEVERGPRGVRAGHQQLPAHRIWEASAHSTAVLDGTTDPSAVCFTFLAKGRVALTQHITAAGLLGAHLAHRGTCCCVCTSAVFAGKGGCSWGAAHEDVSRLALGDTRYLWKRGDKGVCVAWVEGESLGLAGGAGG